jgi:hypothetical protein
LSILRFLPIALTTPTVTELDNPIGIANNNGPLANKNSSFFTDSQIGEFHVIGDNLKERDIKLWIAGKHVGIVFLTAHKFDPYCDRLRDEVLVCYNDTSRIKDNTRSYILHEFFRVFFSSEISFKK